MLEIAPDENLPLPSEGMDREEESEGERRRGDAKGQEDDNLLEDP
jgi:hypothetical protein